jgi:acetyltransferase
MPYQRRVRVNGAVAVNDKAMTTTTAKPAESDTQRLERDHRRRVLDAIFAPRRVAVIGATEHPGSVGRAVLENLSGYGGTIYPVNPKRPTVLGKPSYATIRSVPEKVDLAVIVTPAQTVPSLVRECAEAGVRGAIIISAGFKETGGSGAEMERQILAEAQRGHMRIIGPNCLGVMVPHAGLNATFAASLAKPGNLAFISQSGALCTAILDWSLHEKVGFSAFVSIGSMLDVGWGDLIFYLGDDPSTKGIVMYMESVGDARSFMSAAREVAYTKPIIVIKVGRTDAAAKAAASHTGSLTGSDEVLDAAFRRVGVLRVNTISQLFHMAEVLSKQPRPRGPRLTIITNAGGPGALATDMQISCGGQLAPLQKKTMDALNKLLPPHWSHGNPIDILGDADAERYAKAVELAAADPNSDGLLVILTPQKMTQPVETAERLRSFARLDDKPVIASWMGADTIAQGEAILNDAGIPTFRYPDTAAQAFQFMRYYADNLRSLYETPVLAAESDEAAMHRKLARKLIEAVLKDERTILTELESKEILRAYNIPTVETHVARSEIAAVKLAEKLGFPVVLKLFSQTITHKTDVGGVQLNLRTPAGVRRAWKAIQSSVTAKAGAEHFQGVTVQPMVSLDGYELIVGSSLDPQFGPVLLFGAGGQLVEVMKDRALGLPPLNATLARRLMEQTKIYTALQGVRGRPPVDLAALEQLLVRFSQLVVELPRIKEIDINPLLVSPGRMVALDARIVLHDPQVRPDAIPWPAIRPYPTQYIAKWKLKDGTRVKIRPIRPEDEPLMVRFHQTLSETTVYFRYFAPKPLDQRIAHERLTRICFIDYDREMALVAERRDPRTRVLEIIGVGRLSKLREANEAEFALVISDAWQHRGLGTQFLNMLVQIARDDRLSRITGTILPDNRDMLRVCEKVGFHLRHDPGEGEYRAEFVL